MRSKASPRYMHRAMGDDSTIARAVRGLTLGLSLGGLSGAAFLTYSAYARLTAGCQELSDLECGLRRQTNAELGRWQLMSAAALLLIAIAGFLLYRARAKP